MNIDLKYGLNHNIFRNNANDWDCDDELVVQYDRDVNSVLCLLSETC